MEKNRLGTMEYRFLSLIWDNEPISSMQLVKKCNEEFDWKKSTTFTMLRKLIEKGLVSNEDSTVTSCVNGRERFLYGSDIFRIAAQFPYSIFRR